MTKLYQFRGGFFVYGNDKAYETGRGNWLFTVETDAPLDENTVFRLVMLPKDMQMTEQKKRPNFIARMFM